MAQAHQWPVPRHCAAHACRPGTVADAATARGGASTDQRRRVHVPIYVNELETQVDIEGGGGTQEGQRTQATAAALLRLQELARRDAQLAQRTAAWDFDD